MPGRRRKPLENLALFFTTALTALAVENAIFARSLGLSRAVLIMNRPGVGILYGMLLTWMVTMSSFFVAVVNRFLLGTPYAAVFSLPGYFICVCIVYVATYFVTKAKLPKVFEKIHRALPVSTFNSALFGAFYVSALQNYGFVQTVAYSLGTGLGYTVALLVIYYARKRLAISPVPRSFRGLPVLLVYIGLLSLAIYGLIGHGLLS